MPNLMLKDSIQNMGISGMSQISNSAIIELVNEFDTNPNKSNLAKTLIEIYGQEFFLEQKNIREQVINHLSIENATKLFELFSKKRDGVISVWEQLNKTRLTPENRKIFFNFFGVVGESIEIHVGSDTDQVSTEIIKSSYALFEHQEKAVSEVRKTISNDKRARVLLHMPTGSGKTRTAMNVICDFLRDRISSENKALVVWLADSEELCDQAADEFKKAWQAIGIGEINLHRLYKSYDLNLSEVHSGFLVAGLQKLNPKFKLDQSGILNLGSKTRLLIFDEAHKVLAPTYQHVVDVLQETSGSPLIGLSATPGRKTFDDKHNRDFADFFNRNKIGLSIPGYENPIDYLQGEGYLAHINYHNIPYKSEDLILTEGELNSLREGNDFTSEFLKRLGLDTKRNIKILNTALKEVNLGKRIILFACSVNNAEAIYALLRYKGINAGLVTASTKSFKRQKIIRSYKKGELSILINYGVFVAGFDAPETNVAIIARPTNSLTLYSQMVGRAARGPAVGGNGTCDIYTVVDNLPGFENLVEAFSHWDEIWE
jgi:DNA repair protein RadD